MIRLLWRKFCQRRSRYYALLASVSLLAQDYEVSKHMLRQAAAWDRRGR